MFQKINAERKQQHQQQKSATKILHYISLIPFYTTSLFLNFLKISENQRFSDVFRGFRKRPVA